MELLRTIQEMSHVNPSTSQRSSGESWHIPQTKVASPCRIRRGQVGEETKKASGARRARESQTSALLYGCESWKLTQAVRRKLNLNASKMLSRITGRTIADEARQLSVDVVMRARDQRWNWLGHILRMEGPTSPTPMRQTNPRIYPW